MEGLLFLKKKKQKDFIRWARGGYPPRASMDKSFLLVFYKKEGLTKTIAAPK
jgi:hypothetical protein